METIEQFFKTGSIRENVFCILKISESLSIKIDKLIQSELNAGIQSLEQAANSVSEKESLLREARNRFNKASVLEKRERKIISLLGLYLCHHYLKDHQNEINSLKDILLVNAEDENFLKDMFRGICSANPATFCGGGLGAIFLGGALGITGIGVIPLLLAGGTYSAIKAEQIKEKYEKSVKNIYCLQQEIRVYLKNVHNIDSK